MNVFERSFKVMARRVSEEDFLLESIYLKGTLLSSPTHSNICEAKHLERGKGFTCAK